MKRRIATALVIVSLSSILLTAAGHGILGTKALVEELHKANVNAEWVSAIKAVWVLFSVNMLFLGAMAGASFFRRDPISSQTIGNSIAVLLVAESGYLFVELGFFPGSVLVLIAGVTLLIAGLSRAAARAGSSPAT